MYNEFSANFQYYRDSFKKEKKNMLPSSSPNDPKHTQLCP